MTRKDNLIGTEKINFLKGQAIDGAISSVVRECKYYKILNMKKLIVLLIASLLCPMLSFGQENTVTLVASGDGTSKAEAESLALRSAIEQAFGTFVSTNTTILNDDIVKDEIATVSSGNIESYSIVAESENGGRWHVTVKAVVSINKLVDYAKSHGSSTEFAGQNFAMQMKMRKLNKENEEKALSDLFAEIEQVSSSISLFDYEIIQKEPQFVSDTEYKVPITIIANWNQNGKNLSNLIGNIFYSLSLSSSEQESYKSNNYPMTTCSPLEKITGDDSQYSLRSDLAQSIIEELQFIFLKNLHCFSIVRKGNGDEYKTFLCPISDRDEEFHDHIISFQSIIFQSNPTIPEKVLYETEGFEVIPDLTLGICNNPQLVDLGLSVKWADINVGASPVYPYGGYFAFGETSEKPEYEYDNYSYRREGNGLAPDDDVAHVKFGSNWRTPTAAEWKELKNLCTWTWITLNGINGYKVTSTKNGNSIFLPAAGYCSSRLIGAGSNGSYWSLSQSLLSFGPGSVSLYSTLEGQYGRSVRPVSD